MEPFIVEYKDTKDRFVVLERSGAWWTLADMKSGDLRGAKSLAGYRFIGFVKSGGA